MARLERAGAHKRRNRSLWGQEAAHDVFGGRSKPTLIWDFAQRFPVIAAHLGDAFDLTEAAHG